MEKITKNTILDSDYINNFDPFKLLTVKNIIRKAIVGATHICLAKFPIFPFNYWCVLSYDNRGRNVECKSIRMEDAIDTYLECLQLYAKC